MRKVLALLSLLSLGNCTWPTAMIVTAAVTTASLTDGGPGLTQPAGDFQVVLTNLDTEHSFAWQAKTWPHQFACDAAIKGVNEFLRALADPAGKELPEQATSADPELVNSVRLVVLAIIQNTGRAPNLTVSCELKDARGA